MNDFLEITKELETPYGLDEVYITASVIKDPKVNDLFESADGKDTILQFIADFSFGDFPDTRYKLIAWNIVGEDSETFLNFVNLADGEEGFDYVPEHLQEVSMAVAELIREQITGGLN